MLVLNNLEYDSRVKKEAASLIQAGHALLVFSAQKKAKGASERTAMHFDGVDIPVQPMEIPFSMLERTLAGIALGLQKGVLLFLWPFGVFSHQQQKSEKDKHPLLVSLVKAPVYALRSVLRFLVKTFTIFLPPSWVLRGWRSAVVQWSPDVVHCHDLETCSVGLEVLDQIDCGLVYDSHELWTERTRREVPLFGYFVKRAERAMESKVLEVCGGAITVSPEIADHLASSYRVRREKIAVVRNAPILAAHSTIAVEGRHSGLEEGLGPGSVIYSGRISPKRALEDLLNAVSASGTDKRVFLLGYGGNSYLAYLFGLAGRLGVSLNHLPPVDSDQVPVVLARAEVIFVGVQRASMSYEYALPNKYFEALASGRPVVYPLLTSMARDAAKFASCVGYQPGNIDDLAGALARTSKMQVNGREAEERLQAADWANEAQVMLGLYGRTISRARQS